MKNLWMRWHRLWTTGQKRTRPGAFRKLLPPPQRQWAEMEKSSDQIGLIDQITLSNNSSGLFDQNILIYINILQIICIDLLTSKFFIHTYFWNALFFFSIWTKKYIIKKIKLKVQKLNFIILTIILNAERNLFINAIIISGKQHNLFQGVLAKHLLNYKWQAPPLSW